jgi:aspartate/methionine/tyrosine aminotransferase
VSIFRQVLSLVELPELADARFFPNDVVLRARNVSRRADNERHVREAVARHILVRDKGKREHTCNADHIVLSNGARDVSLAIQLHLCSELDGILVPSPDFTFAPSAALHGARVFRYGLEYASQEAEWRLSVRELEAALARARAQVFVRCIAHSPTPCRAHVQVPHASGTSAPWRWLAVLNI